MCLKSFERRLASAVDLLALAASIASAQIDAFTNQGRGSQRPRLESRWTLHQRAGALTAHRSSSSSENC